MNDPNKRKSSVFTKGQIKDILEGIVNDTKPLKSVKEVRELLEQKVVQYTPQRAGRGTAIDYNSMQTFINEAAKKIVGGKVSTLVNQAVYLWNKNNENRMIGNLQVMMAIKNKKVLLPEGYVLSVRPRKQKSLVASEVSV